MSLYSVRDLTKLTGIPARRFRYVVDHRLIPDRNWFVGQGEAGNPRYFDLTTAWYVVCAAAMMEAGVRRENVQRFMEISDRVTPVAKKRGLTLNVIDEALLSWQPARIIVGDDTYIKGVVGTGTDTGWLDLETGLSGVKDFTPYIAVVVDIGRIRDSLKNFADQA